MAHAWSVAVHGKDHACVHQHGPHGRQGFRNWSRQLEEAHRKVDDRSKRQSKEQVMQVNPYLFYNGNCETAFKFYEKALGGKIEMMMTHEGTPAAEHVPPEWHKKIMHARLSIDGEVLMASDAISGHFK